MNDTRTLIKENTALAHEIAGDLVQFKPTLADLKRAYEALEVGPFSNEIFKKLILTGTTDTIAFYVTTLNDQLNKLGITSSTMRSNAISGYDHIIEGLNMAVTAAKAFKPTIYGHRAILSMKFISFTDRFIITDEDFEAILEAFARTYISEEEKPFLELAQELTASYNKLLTFLDEQGVNSPFRLNHLQFILSIDSNGTAIIDAGKLKGLFTYKQRAKEFRAI